MNILFMCVANSARSQMAEGLAKEIFGNRAKIESAGSNPSQVNPLAIEVMHELGIDISKQHSKNTDDLSPQFIHNLQLVITLCAEEVCLVLTSKAKKLHWPLPGPAGNCEKPREEQLSKFREVRNAIQVKLKVLKSELRL